MTDSMQEFLAGIKGDLEKVASDETTALKEAGLMSDSPDEDEFGSYAASEQLASFLEAETDILRKKNNALEKTAYPDDEEDLENLGAGEEDDEGGEPADDSAVKSVLDALESGGGGEGDAGDMGDMGSVEDMEEEDYKTASAEEGLLVFGVPLNELMEKEAFVKGFHSVAGSYNPLIEDVTFSTIQAVNS